MNSTYARACMRDCVERGEAPLASHLLYTQPGILNDSIPQQRQLGIDIGFAWNRFAEKTVVYSDLGISEGMLQGMKNAVAAGREIEHRRIGFGWAPKSNLRPQEKIEDVRLAIIKLIGAAFKFVSASNAEQFKEAERIMDEQQKKILAAV